MTYDNLVKFCKENNIILKHYTSKLVEFNTSKFNSFIDKVHEKKYSKVMFYLDLSKIHKQFADRLLDNENQDSVGNDRYNHYYMIYNIHRCLSPLYHEVTEKDIRLMIKDSHLNVINYILCFEDVESYNSCNNCTANYCHNNIVNTKKLWMTLYI